MMAQFYWVVVVVVVGGGGGGGGGGDVHKPVPHVLDIHIQQ